MGSSHNGGENSTGLNNPNIDGFYFDDAWTNKTSQNEVNKTCIGILMVELVKNKHFAQLTLV